MPRNRMGSIDTLDSGRFSVRVTDINGKRARLPGGPWDTHDAATRALAAWIAERPTDRETAAVIAAREARVRTPLKEVYERFVRNVAKAPLDESTDRQTFHRNVITGEAFQWVPVELKGKQRRPRFEKVSPVPGRMILGDMPINAITGDVIEDWAHSLQGGEYPLSSVTINKWGRHLSQCFDWAILRHYITVNPMEGAQLGASGTDVQRYYFTLEELQRLWYYTPIEYRTLLETLIFCGVRQGEARALTPEALSPKSSLLDIFQTVHEPNGKPAFLGDPKTKASTRRIAIPTRLMGDLSTLARKTTNGEVLFPAVDGDTLMRGSYLNDLFRRWCDDAGIVGNPRDRMPGRRKPPTPHDLRATGASLLLACGASIPETVLWLGHGSPHMTLTVYAKVRPFGEEDSIATECKREGMTVGQILDRLYEEVCTSPLSVDAGDPPERDETVEDLMALDEF